MSIKELSRLTGISHPYISQLENGKRDIPKTSIIRKLSKGLNVPYVELLMVSEHLTEADIQEYLSQKKTQRS